MKAFLSYLAYVALLALVASAFGAIWHDFSVEFHKSVHRAVIKSEKKRGRF
jgi:hypothetical protein